MNQGMNQAASRPRYYRAVNDRLRTLVTPEGISLPITLASRGSRFGALFIDLVLIVLLIALSSILFVFLASSLGLANLREQDSAGGHAIQFLYVLWIASIFLFRNAYFLFFELGPRGATPGKRLTGIRIAARDGGRLTAEMVLARNLLRDIELFLPVIFVLSASMGGGDTGAATLAGAAWFLIFALFPCFNRDRLRAGDIIAGSWVLEVPKRKLLGAMSVAPAAGGNARHAATSGEYRFSQAELTVYGEYELQALERVLRDGRGEASRAVYEAICAKIGWAPGGGDERAFLEAYYTQLRARLEANMRMGKRKADKFE
jgi:uncharacterized RDD family membrane protein YckC